MVRARGLPWQASDTDIARFFTGLNVAPGGERDIGINVLMDQLERRSHSRGSVPVPYEDLT